MPRLQQLLGDPLKGLQVCGGLDGPAHPFQLKLLAEAEGEWFRHGAPLGSVDPLTLQSVSFACVAVATGRALCVGSLFWGSPSRGLGVASGLLAQLLDAAGHAGSVVQGAGGDALEVHLKGVTGLGLFGLEALAHGLKTRGFEAHGPMAEVARAHVCKSHDPLLQRRLVSLCTPNRTHQGNESSCLS
ncbi:MAG: hypothetical protein ACK56F_05720, partial [bacterium]